MKQKKQPDLVDEQDILHVLERARARIESPNRWMRRAYRDQSNRGPDTCRVCALGALRWATIGDPMSYDPTTLAAEIKLQQHLGGINLAEFNDASKHADVLELFDTVISDQKLLVAQLKMGAE